MLTEYIPLDLFDEIKLDTLGRQTEYGAIVLRQRRFVIVELRSRVIAAIILRDFDETIVTNAAGLGDIDDFSIAGLAEVHFASAALVQVADIDLAQLVVRMQRAHPIVKLPSI